MNEETKKIVAKIQKLFAMAEHAGSNEHEATKAAQMAESLLRAHNLSMTDITPAQAVKNVIENTMAKYKWTPGRAPQWATGLAVAIANAHDTFVVWRRAATTDSHVRRAQQHLTFIGSEADVLISGEVFNYLFVAIQRMTEEYFVNEYIPPTKGKTYKNSFRSGMSNRFYQRFAEMTAEKDKEFQEAAKTGTSLVVIKKDAIADYMGGKAEYQTSTRQSQTDGRAYRAGYTKAGEVSLNKQMR